MKQNAKQPAGRTIFNIRPAKVSDLKSIARVRQTTWLKTYPNSKLGITAADIKELCANPSWQTGWRKSLMAPNRKVRLWVAIKNRAVIGFCGASKINGIHEISAIYILPKFQSMGLGRQFIQLALGWLGSKKDIMVSVASYNKAALSFYKKFGFKIRRKHLAKSVILKSGKRVTLPEIDLVKK